MIFNSWAIVYGTDGTLGIAKTIIDGFCFPPSLLDSKEWNTFFFPRRELFSFQLQPISNKQLSVAYSVLSTITWVLAFSLLIMVGLPRFEIIVLGKSYYLVLTCSLYIAYFQAKSHSFSFRKLKPKLRITTNKISKKQSNPKQSPSEAKMVGTECHLL